MTDVHLVAPEYRALGSSILYYQRAVGNATSLGEGQEGGVRQI